MIFALLAIAAATNWHKNPHAEARLIVGEQRLVAGRDVVDAGVQFKVRPGWHVYWKNSGDAGFAPKATPDNSGDVAEVDLSWPAPQRFALKGGLEAFGYVDEVVYPLRVVLKRPAARGQIELRLAFDYLVCEDECVPYLDTFALTLAVGDADVTDPETSVLLAAARKRVPVPTSDISARYDGALLLHALGDDVFFETDDRFDLGKPVALGNGDFSVPMKSKILGPLPQFASFAVTVTGDSPREQLVRVNLRAQPASLLLMLLFGVLGGFLLNLMPCVLPVLSLKLLGLVEHESERDARIGALWSTLGILSSFLLLALAVLGLRLSGWGAQFQEPGFVAFLAVVVTAFALNLWGVFELPLPERLGRLAGVGGKRGPLAHFFAGLFATLLATPCSAPFLGTAIAFALSSTNAVVITMFLAVGVGMSAPYFALAAWPAVVHHLPRPGAWMLHLRQALGFALAATAVWLLFVLSGQLEQTRVAVLELGLLLLAALLWLAQLTHRRMVWALALVCAIAVVFVARDEPAPASGITWQPFDAQKLAALQARGHPVFVDVTADWCFTCKVNERAVLGSEAVARAFTRCGVVAMKADWTKRDAAIAAFLSANGRTGIPFYLSGMQVLPELLTQASVIDSLACPAR